MFTPMCRHAHAGPGSWCCRRRDRPVRPRRLDAEPRFYPDDPIAREPESQDASKAAPLRPVADVRAGRTTCSSTPATSRAACARRTSTRSTRCRTRAGSPTASAPGRSRLRSSCAAPNVGAPPDPSKWVLIREKTSGAHPGFTAKDAKGETWFLEFDPPYFPEGATGAVAIATKIFWALGYNQVESFLTTFDPKKTSIDPKATVRRPNGKRTPVHPRRHQRDPRDRRAQPGRHLSRRRRPPAAGQDSRRLPVRRHAPRRSQRSRAARAPARAAGAARLRRVDEPHRPQGREHARHAASPRTARPIVKHYLQDVGSTFGMCNDLHEWDLSYEYFYEGGPSRKRFFTLGFGLSPWQTVDYVEYPSVGKFEGKVFDPRKWRPQTPTAGLHGAARRRRVLGGAARRGLHRRPDPGGRPHGQFSNPRGREVSRRRADPAPGDDQAHLPDAGEPDRQPAPRCNGTDVRERGGRRRRRAAAPWRTARSWMVFDNATGATRPLSETKSETTTIPAPSGLPSSGFVAVDIAADSRCLSDVEDSPCAPTSDRTAGAGSSSASSGCRRICLPARPAARRIDEVAPPAAPAHAADE